MNEPRPESPPAGMGAYAAKTQRCQGAQVDRPKSTGLGPQMSRPWIATPAARPRSYETWRKT
jgi:hypothetical protein